MGVLRHRLAIATGSGVACVLLLLVLLFHQQQRAPMLAAGGSALLRQQQRMAQAIDQAFERTEQRAAELSAQLRQVRPNPAQLVSMLEAKLLHDGESVQFGIMLEADNPVAPGRRFAVGEYFDATGPRTVDFVQTGYDYWNKGWYKDALLRHQGSWSEVYFNDAAGGIDNITYDRPLRDANGHAFGALSISLALDRIAEIARAAGWARTRGGALHLLLDADGRILLADDPAVERAYTVASPVIQRAHPLAAWVARQPRSSQPRLERDAAAGAAYVRVPLPRVGWQLVAQLDDAQVLRPLWRDTWIGIALALLLGLLAGALMGMLLRRQRRPLLALAAAVDRLGDGHFDVPMPAAGPVPELARLTRALERSRRTLQQYSGQARDARDAELLDEGRREFAGRLQQAQLPEDRVFLGSQLQVHACAGLRSGHALDTCFYGHFSPAPGAFAFYLGALEGNQEPAILQLGRINATVALAARTAAAPAAVLAAVAGQLAGAHAGEVPVALLAGRVDLEQRVLAVANAGAGGALLLRDGRQQLLPLPITATLSRDTRGPWPGWQGAIAAGDRLLLAPALLASATAAGNPLRSLQVAVERHAELPARAMLDAVLAAMDEAIPELVAHDRALLLLDIRHRDQ